MIELIGQPAESLFDIEKRTVKELENTLNNGGLTLQEMTIMGFVRVMMTTAKVNAIVKLLADGQIADAEDFAVAHIDALREMIGKLNEQLTRPVSATMEDLQRLKRQ